MLVKQPIYSSKTLKREDNKLKDSIQEELDKMLEELDNKVYTIEMVKKGTIKFFTVDKEYCNSFIEEMINQGWSLLGKK